MEWFKLYDEASDDKKLATLSAEQFRVWFNLMCLANRGTVRGTVTWDDDELMALEVAGCDTALLLASLDRLRKLRIVAGDNGAIHFVNWEKRQKRAPSDDPSATAERKRKSREARRTTADVTGDASQNAGVTDESRGVTDGHALEKKREEERRKNPPNPQGDGENPGSVDETGKPGDKPPTVKADPDQPLRDLYAGFRKAYYPDRDPAFWERIPSVEFDDRPTKARLRALLKDHVTPEELCRMTTAAIGRADGKREFVTLRSVMAQWTANAEREKNPPAAADGPVKPVDDPMLPISAKSRGTLSDCRFAGHPSRSEILAAGNRLPKWQGYEVATSGTGNQSRTNEPVPGWPCRDGHWYRPGPGGYDDFPIRCDERGNITALTGRP